MSSKELPRIIESQALRKCALGPIEFHSLCPYAAR